MEKKTALPKNVRQIGDIRGNKRIYLEDYVVTYIHKKEKQEDTEGFLGVLLGEVQKEEGEIRMFIRGLMSVSLDRWTAEAEENPEDQIMVLKETEQYKENSIQEKPEDKNGSDHKNPESGKIPVDGEEKKNAGPLLQVGRKTRKHRTVLEECKDYFGEMEVIGCCVIGKYPVEPMKKLMEEVPQSRRLLYHLQDQEEHLYWTETGKYEEISGYFVFYEQNKCMQEYLAEMFHEKEEDKEKIKDQAIKAFREKIKKKDQMHTAGMMKLASSFFVVTVLIIGAVVVTRTGSIRNSPGSSVTEADPTVRSAMSDSAGEAKAGEVPEDEIAAAAAERTISAGMEEAAVTDGMPAAVTAENTATTANASAVGMTNTGAEENTAAAGNVSAAGTTDTESSVENGTAANAAAVSQEAALEDGTTADGKSAADTVDTGTSASEGGAAAGAGEDVEASAQIRQTKASYVIREGDTLADICQKYYGSLNKLEEICQENGIQDADKIMPGQKITLP